MPVRFFTLASRRLLASAAGAVALALLGACSKTPPPEEPLRAVKLILVGASPLQAGHEYAGEVRARVESRLGFRVAGKITRRAVELGQRVAAGQLLAQLDAQDYRLAADAARAQAAAAATQRDLAAADLRRFEALRAQNFISGAELERREAQFKAAQAALDQAQAQLAAQGHQAAYTQLLADAPGVVTAVEAEAGQVVAAGAPVVRIAQDGPRDVLFAVPEDRVAAMQLGTPLTARAWQGGAPLAGAVREVAASADPVTRTYAVKLALAGGEAPPLGATVYVTPPAAGTAAAPQVIKLPTSALRQEGRGSAVWVLEPASMSVRSQPVQIATVDGNEAVVASGLQPGQQVVVAGVHLLSPGQKVTVYQPKAALAQAGQDAPAAGPVAPAAR